jgi:hypothetical protein
MPSGSMTELQETHDAFDEIVAEQEQLRQLAYAEATRGMGLRPDAARLDSLEEAARARVRSHNAEVFDPQENPDDRAREEKFNKLKQDADFQEQALQLAQAKVRECRERVAELPSGTEPTISFSLWVVTAVATLALAATIVPTVIDTLSGTSLPQGAILIVAVALGSIFGLYVTGSIVLTYKLSGKRTVMGLSGLIGGLVIALGFLVFRCHIALDSHDLLVAIGLATIEVGAILVLEWIGGHLRRVYSEWLAVKMDRDKAQALLMAATVEEERRKAILEATLRQQRSHIAYLEERFIRRVRAPELEDAAIRATREGYLSGIEANRGSVQAA